MITLMDHALLWGAFFVLGLLLGFYMGYGLIPSNRGRRL